MAISEVWTEIVASQTDADSPIDQTLMDSIRKNFYHLKYWLGKNYTADDDHDHDGINSKSVVLADDSVTQAKIGPNAVGLSELKCTDDAGGSATVTTLFTMVGGRYSFHPQTKVSAANQWKSGLGPNTAVSFGTYLYAEEMQDGATFYYVNSYVAASGEQFWIFILRNRITKEIIATSYAPDHPCFGQRAGPDVFPHPFADFYNKPLGDLEILAVLPKKAELSAIKAKLKKGQIIAELIHGTDVLFDVDDSGPEPAWTNLDITVDVGIKQKIPKPPNVRVVKLKPKKP